MRLVRNTVLPVLLSLFLGGCANPLHYGWSYVPLHDARSEMFLPPEGEVEYTELKDLKEMPGAELEMYRKGYVMVGYSNMLSPQPDMIAPGAARQWGQEVGASAVLHTFGKSHYLATYWARPRRFVFGAYYTNNVPPDARAALKEALKSDRCVIVENVVDGSPAFAAGVRPGDLLVELNGERIQGAAVLDKMLRANEGKGVTLLVWSMVEGPPRPLKVALNPLVK